MTATISPSTTKTPTKRAPKNAAKTDRPSAPTPAAQDDSTAVLQLIPTHDWEEFADELDQIRADITASLGPADAAYLYRLVRTQRALEIGGRVALWAGIFPPAWIAGVTMLSLSKILENMELGHNVMHGQWDWLNDPAIHSTTWEWDNVCTTEQWKHSHNYVHHHFTNIDGKDGDIGYGIIRIHPGQKYEKAYRGQVLYAALLALLFEWGVGAHDSDADVNALLRTEKGTPEHDEAKAALKTKLSDFRRKIAKQVAKDYVAFPALSIPFGPAGVLATASGNLAANLVRNVWAFSVIFCGHFPDGAEYFPTDTAENETRGQWYRRQVLGSANFTGGRLMDIMSGNLNHQVEHHLYPDLPSNRYAEIAPRVQAACARHGLPYNTGSFRKQFGSVIRKIAQYSRPNPT